jgi:hypothetical protein
MSDKFIENEEGETVRIPDAAEEVKQENINVAIQEPNQLDEYQEMNKFIEDPENKQKAVFLANQIQGIVGKNWFTLRRLVSKTVENELTAYQKLKLCMMFGFCTSRVGDWKDGKENVRVSLFKITIDKSERIKAIDDIISSLKGQIDQLELEKAGLKA